MIRICLSCVALALWLSFTFHAEARPTARVLASPPALPIVMLVRPVPIGSLRLPGPDAALAMLTRRIEGRRSQALVRSSDDRSAEALLRELATTAREDTSLGVRSAPMSMWGAGIVGFGLCGDVALRLGARRMPGIVGLIGPLGLPGGGGIRLSRHF